MELIELVWKVGDWKAVEAIISQSNNKIVLPTTLNGWIRVYKDVHGDGKLGVLARMTVLPDTTVTEWIEVWNNTSYDASLQVRTVVVDKIISLDPTYEECKTLYDSCRSITFQNMPNFGPLIKKLFEEMARKASGFEQSYNIFRNGYSEEMNLRDQAFTDT
jgi:hypothetical protein